MRNAKDANTNADTATRTRIAGAGAILGLLGLSVAAGGCSMASDTGSPHSYNYPTGGGSTSDPTGAAGSLSDAGGGGADDDAAAPTVDSTSILAAIANGGYKSSNFVHVTETPYPSSVATGSTIDEWVSTLGASDYLAISPDGGAVSANLPPGAIIVRAVLDGTGAVTELTLLSKGPSGYNPTIGDWWWGVTDPQGVPQTSDAGPMLGQLTQCYTCHVPHQAEDFLFGAPLDDRAPPGTLGTADAGSGTSTVDAGMDSGTDSGTDASTDSGDDDSGSHHHHGGGN